MRSPLVFCAGSLLCVSCAAEAADVDPAPHDISTDAVARQVATTERDRLQAWCAENERTGSDVGLRVVDLREPGEKTTDVLCSEITAEPATTTEAVGEARQGLTPLGLACGLGILALGATSFKFCREHPEVKYCGEKFAAGTGGLGLVCTIFF
jgi:hypothetical protein